MDSLTALTMHALSADQARAERIASNLANVQTPGHKREVQVEHAGLAGVGRVDAQAAFGRVFEHVRSATVRDFTTGTQRITGRALDLALVSGGFFEVATDSGPAFTRRGDLQLDGRGRLVTAAGNPVLGLGGEIALSSERPRIDEMGRIYEGDQLVAQLRVVDISPDELRVGPGGLFTTSGAVKDMPVSSAVLRQGALENSNVNSAHEMVDLTTTVRHFEAVLRVTQARDEMLGTAIRRLTES
jgi:flagellar basal-body rod protein FlgF